MRAGRWRAVSRDEGSTQIILLVAMVCAFGLTLMAIQVARANDLRSQGQIAADAAALAAVTPMRDAVLDAARNGQLPSGIGLWTIADNVNADNTPFAEAARDYAGRNAAELRGDVEPSGALGHTMKVSVQTKDCVIKDEDELTAKDRQDLANRRNLCTDNRGRTGIIKGRGTADAIAELRLPECEYRNTGGRGSEEAPFFDELWCDNVRVWSDTQGPAPRDRVIRLFKIRLVGKEDPVKYTGMPENGLPSGPYVKGECAKDKQPDPSMPFGHRVIAWARCWFGTPYSWGGGTPAGPSKGICCSPGGYSGANTVGFDCSGLTLYAVYQASGGRITLPHYTLSQLSDPRGRRVSQSELQPGDLVLPNPGHIGIYAGGGRFIEAPQTGDVVKESTLAGRGFYGAVRFG
ncbi:C40 family peptidase [Actinomadura sp. NPDC047616]|uniref:C40 family peptidase n=1 Tax=Actinomadura sp. NPDC047616 TaxID=3155914 RepID=UPI0033E03173